MNRNLCVLFLLMIMSTAIGNTTVRNKTQKRVKAVFLKNNYDEVQLRRTLMYSYKNFIDPNLDKTFGTSVPGNYFLIIPNDMTDWQPWCFQVPIDTDDTFEIHSAANQVTVKKIDSYGSTDMPTAELPIDFSRDTILMYLNS